MREQVLRPYIHPEAADLPDGLIRDNPPQIRLSLNFSRQEYAFPFRKAPRIYGKG